MIEILCNLHPGGMYRSVEGNKPPTIASRQGSIP
jgi:hypothetical protein